MKKNKLKCLIFIQIFIMSTIFLANLSYTSNDLQFSIVNTNNLALITAFSGWTKAKIISDDDTGWNTGSSQYPYIVIDDNGNIHVVWADITNGEWGNDQEIMYANYTTKGWSNATAISDIYGWNNGHSYYPCMATDNNGNIHLVWADDTDGEWGTDVEIMYANYTATGWSNATVISDDSSGWNNGSSWNPTITIDNNSDIHVVWDDDTNGTWGTDNEIMYANCTDAGWSNATVISDDSYGWNNGESYFPQIATDNNGDIHVVWEDWTSSLGEWGNDREIMYVNYTAMGWSNATVISDLYGWNSGDSFQPDLITDNNGIIHVVWADATFGEWGTDIEIMYTNYTAAGWSNATVISDDSTGWNIETSTQPSITMDSNENLHVVWTDNTDGTWGIDWEVMYTNNIGAIWSNATVISDDSSGWNNDSSRQPQIALDNNGNIHIVWEDNTNGAWGVDWEIMYVNNICEDKGQDLGFIFLLGIQEQPNYGLIFVMIGIGSVIVVAIIIVRIKRRK